MLAIRIRTGRRHQIRSLARVGELYTLVVSGDVGQHLVEEGSQVEEEQELQTPGHIPKVDPP